MLGRSPEYSNSEQLLISHFGFQDVAANVFPGVLYPMIAVHAFINNENSKWEVSLRRVLQALEKNTPRRMTPEFDALIDT